MNTCIYPTKCCYKIQPKVKVKEEQCKKLKLKPQSVETEEKKDDKQKVANFLTIS